MTNKNDVMQLHELKQGDRFRINGDATGEVIVFDHLDGMYSYCTTEKDGAVIHLKHWTPVQKL